MKEKINRLILLVCLTFACVIGFAACNLVTPVDFKLQFIVDGEIYATIDTAGEETIRLPDDPEKNGYIFDGWYWDENTWERPFTADSLLNEKLTSDMSVYAKWKDEDAVIREFTVTFNSMGGSSVESKTVKDGDFLTEPAEPKYNGYIFNGWYKDEACTQSWIFESDKVTASITLYAGWVEETATTYTVTYIDGAETLYTKKVVENGKAENIAIFKEGYTFKGWLLDDAAFDFATPITENITLTADWEIKTYTVTFIVDGEQVEQFEVDYLGSVPKIPEVPAKIGYTGTWNITDFTNITKELTVTAVYTAKTYTATLDYAGANTGNSVQSIMLTYGQPIGTLPTPGKTDCTFSGWFYEGTQISASTIWQNDVSIEIKFTAKWIVADNGHVIVSSDHFTFTDETTLTQDGTLRNVVDTYDLRGKFTVSAGASWRAFTNEECVPTSEITTRIASVNPGWNNVYILVENNTTYEQSVYNLRIYRNRILQVPVYYNETVQYNSVNFEENVAAGETENAVFPAFTVENYSCDGKYYSDARYTTEWTDDVFVTEATAIYIQAYCHDVTVDGNTVTGMNQQSGKVHLVIPETVNGKTITSIASEAFKDTLLVAFGCSDQITFIGENAFANTPFLNNEASYINGALYVGKCLVATNKNLAQSYSVEPGTRQIATGAFINQTNILQINIPNSVTSIGSSAFRNCSSLTSITVPNSVASIGSSAFLGCSNLISITLPFVGSSSAQENGFFGYVFGALDYEENPDYVPTTLHEVIITGGTKVTAYAFLNCNYIEKLIFPDSVVQMGLGALRGCISLKELIIPFAGEAKDQTEYTNLGFIFNWLWDHNNREVPDSLKSVTIIGESIGESAFSGCSGLTRITIGNGVTSIGNSAFEGCSGLTGIEIPASVTSIGDSAFYGCSGLTSIEIPGGVTSIGNFAFSACSSLTSITIPDSISSIGNNAFSRCSSLTNLMIPDSVTSIGEYAFYNCSSLESITLPFVGATKDETNNKHFGYIFGASSYSSNSSYVPTSLKTVVITGGDSIGSSAFQDCSSLTSIAFGENSQLTSIGSFAFYNCSSLTSIAFGENSQLTSIGRSAFYNCSSLEAVYITDIAAWCEILFSDYSSNPVCYAGALYLDSELVTELVIPDSVSSIENYAFSGCSSLTNLMIPDSVTNIGDSAFEDCSGLTGIAIPDSVTSIGSSAFSGCSGLTSIAIPNSVTSIGFRAFEDCNSLTCITLPFVGAIKDGTNNTYFGYIFGARSSFYNDEYVPTSLHTVIITGGTSIGSGAFYYCSWFTSVMIPDSVTSIGSSAFAGCSSLTSIAIPNGVTSIGNEAFSGCYKLVEVYNMSELPIVAGTKDYGYVAYYAKNVYTQEGESWFTDTAEGYRFFYDGSKGYLLGYNGTDKELILPNSFTEHNGTEITEYEIYQYAFYNCSGLTSIEIPASVTIIGSSAFYNCSGLTSVLFGEDSRLASIGEYAFYNCSGLTNITIPDNVTSIYEKTFCNCSGLMSVSFDINSQLTSIGDSAFYGCNGLTSIEIPSGVTDIAYNSFYDCENLENIYYLGTLADWCSIIDLGAILSDTSNGVRFYIDGIEIKGDIVIPEGVTYIGVSTFEKCDKITSIKIPSTVEIIYNSAFKGCSSLERVIFAENSRLKIIAAYVFEDTKVKSINIPRSVTTIYGGWYDSEVLESVYIDDLTAWFSISFIETHSNPLDYADNFYCNDKLVSGELVIPADVTKIKANVLGRYYKINKIVIPESVTSIEDQAFSGCSGLSVIEVDPNNQYYCSEDGILYNKNKTEIICYPSAKNGEQFVIPDSVTNIMGGAFYGCNSLIKVVIPDGVTTIGDYAFYGCSNLTEIEIPSSVKNIGDKAFYGCESIVSVVIPNSVTGIGEGAFEECNSLESITIPFIGESRYATTNTHFGYIFGAYSDSSNSNFVPDSLHTVMITDCVKIASYAFYGCNMLTDITIPDSVTSIGKYAFEKCSSLENITVPAFVVSYLPKENLVNVVITSGEAIEANAFKGSNRLISITIADSVVDIGNQAFEGCTSIENAVIPAMIISYIPKDNLETVVITSGEEIPAYAFENCSSLTSIVISDSVTSIGYRAFYNCSGLTNIEIPASVTSIGSSAFEGCSNLLSVYITDIAAWCNISFAGSWEDGYSNPLYYAKDLYINSIKTTSLEIPNTVSSIGAYAFINCEALTAVQIPNSVTSIGRYAFKGTGLEKVYIDDLAAWCKISFENYASNPLCSETATLYLNGILVTHIQIPENVTEIKNYTFLNCSSLTSVKIHNKVTSIGQDAFSSCVGLKDIEIPNGVTIIGVEAFWGCNKLESVTIGNNVKTIGFMAFAYCESITTINIPNSLTSIEGDAFVRCMSLTAVYIEDLVSWCAISFADKYSNPLSYAKTLYLNGELVTDLNIPDSLTSISNYAFYNCSSLTSITIPYGVTSIGSEAFSGCYKLVEVYNMSELPIVAGTKDYGFVAYYAKNVYTQEGESWITDTAEGYRFFYDGSKGYLLGYNGTDKELILPNSFTEHNGMEITEYEIYQYSFYNCSSLTSIEIPASVTSIGSYAFYNCSGLTSIEIPASVTSVGSSAFSGCSDLKSVLFGENSQLTSIGWSAFFNCSGLTSIEIPASMTSIGSYAFSGCSSLTSISYTGTMEQWNAITKGNSWNNNTGNYIIVCNDGTINKN